MGSEAFWDRMFRTTFKKDKYLDGFPGLVGNTPLVELISLSKVTGCRILVKIELEVMQRILVPVPMIIPLFVVYIIRQRQSS